MLSRQSSGSPFVGSALVVWKEGMSLGNDDFYQSATIEEPNHDSAVFQELITKHRFDLTELIGPKTDKEIKRLKVRIQDETNGHNQAQQRLTKLQVDERNLLDQLSKVRESIETESHRVKWSQNEIASLESDRDHALEQRRIVDYVQHKPEAEKLCAKLPIPKVRMHVGLNSQEAWDALTTPDHIEEKNNWLFNMGYGEQCGFLTIYKRENESTEDYRNRLKSALDWDDIFEREMVPIEAEIAKLKAEMAELAKRSAAKMSNCDGGDGTVNDGADMEARPSKRVKRSESN